MVYLNAVPMFLEWSSQSTQHILIRCSDLVPGLKAFWEVSTFWICLYWLQLIHNLSLWLLPQCCGFSHYPPPLYYLTVLARRYLNIYSDLFLCSFFKYELSILCSSLVFFNKGVWWVVVVMQTMSLGRHVAMSRQSISCYNMGMPMASSGWRPEMPLSTLQLKILP